MQTFQVVPFFATPTKSLLLGVRSPEIVALIIASCWALSMVGILSWWLHPWNHIKYTYSEAQGALIPKISVGGFSISTCMIKSQVANDADLQKYATTAFCCRSSLIIVVTFTSPVQKISMVTPLCDIGGYGQCTHTFHSRCIYDVLFMGCTKLLWSHGGDISARHVGIHQCSVSCAEHATSLFLLLDGLSLHPLENRTIAHKLVLSSASLTQEVRRGTCDRCEHGPKLWICKFWWSFPSNSHPGSALTWWIGLHVWLKCCWETAVKNHIQDFILHLTNHESQTFLIGLNAISPVTAAVSLDFSQTHHFCWPWMNPQFWQMPIQHWGDVGPCVGSRKVRKSPHQYFWIWSVCNGFWNFSPTCFSHVELTAESILIW